MNNKSLKTVIISICLTLSYITNGYTQNEYQITPYDAEGPFYPVNKESDEDNDLTHVEGKSGSAKGDVLNLTGVVVNTDGIPHNNVEIEIWQTDAIGLYKHPRDTTPGKRDPFFQYWGKTKTDKEGKYSFKTLIPGEYKPRPTHIHFKVWVDKKVMLTSQMYTQVQL